MPQAKPSIPRPTRPDLVAALCRNDTYIRDFEKNRKRLELAASDKLWLDDRGIRDDKVVIIPLSPVDDEATASASAVSAFLDRWPMLLRPIPPGNGRERPDDFVDYLRGAVEIIRGDHKGRGMIVSISRSPWRSASSHNIHRGRFLTVSIDLTRSPEEITDEVKLHLADYQRDWQEYSTLGGRIALPPATSRARGQERDVDRWKAYDVFVNKGNRDVKKTAQILFPGSYRHIKDKAEVKEELGKWLAERGGRNAPSKVLAEYDTKLSRMKCSTLRGRERERKEKWILAAVEACKRMIAAQTPSSET